jgi:hypothetical protein
MDTDSQQSLGSDMGLGPDGNEGGEADTQQQQDQGENAVDVEDISFLTRFMVRGRCT